MMVDAAACAERLVSLYNARDFDAMEPLIAPDLDFAHFNRDFAFRERDGLMAVLRMFARDLLPDRRFLPPERVTVAGHTCIREGYYTGTAQVDLPGFAAAGGKVMLKFCSVMRFNEAGVLVEWKDYG
jgi:SnoaL-like domain